MKNFKTDDARSPSPRRRPEPEPNAAPEPTPRTTTTTIPPPVCRPISIVFAISPCAARPISITYKKRAAREKEEAIKYANSSLLERLIAIVDNFELGLSAAKGEGEKSPIYSGMSMVLKQLTDFLADNGLQPIDAEGQKFDPNLHEAIAHEASDEVPEGVVLRQMRRGYRLKDRLLRPSSVVVSSGQRTRCSERR